MTQFYIILSVSPELFRSFLYKTMMKKKQKNLLSESKFSTSTITFFFCTSVRSTSDCYEKFGRLILIKLILSSSPFSSISCSICNWYSYYFYFYNLASFTYLICCYFNRNIDWYLNFKGLIFYRLWSGFWLFRSRDYVPWVLYFTYLLCMRMFGLDETLETLLYFS